MEGKRKRTDKSEGVSGTTEGEIRFYPPCKIPSYPSRGSRKGEGEGILRESGKGGKLALTPLEKRRERLDRMRPKKTTLLNPS